MNITEIRTLVKQQFPDAVIIERVCKEALILRTESASDHAEILFLCAEAISTQPHRNQEAAGYADRAMTLAVANNMFLTAVQAAGLRISCLAPSRSAEEVIADISALRDDIIDTWVPQMKPTIADSNRATGLLFGLQKFGQRLAQERSYQSA